MYNKILVPLDGSELAEQVLTQVMELANSTGAEIVLLRVPDVPVYDYLMTIPELGSKMREQAEDDARNYLARLGEEFRAMGLKVQTHLASRGAVYTTILEVAQELRVDMIAMSTHGRSGLARLVMGSVADDVVRHARMPVMVMRPQPVNAARRADYDAPYATLPVH